MMGSLSEYIGELSYKLMTEAKKTKNEVNNIIIQNIGDVKKETKRLIEDSLNWAEESYKLQKKSNQGSLREGY